MRQSRSVPLALAMIAAVCLGQASSDAIEPGHRGGVVDAALSPDGRTIATASGDRSVKLWDTTSGQCTRTLQGHTICASAVAFSPDGQMLASGGWGGQVVLWDLASGEARAKATTAGHIVQSLTWLADGKHLLAVFSDGEQRHEAVLDSAELAVVRKGDPIKARQIAISPNGAHLAIGQTVQEIGQARRLEIVIKNTRTGEVARRIEAPWDRINDLAFSPAGDRLAVAFHGEGGAGIAMIDPASGERLWVAPTGEGEPEILRGLVFSGDGKRLAGMTRRGNPPLAFVDTATGQRWVGEEHAKKQAATNAAREAAEAADDKTFVPWRAFAGLNTGRGAWLALSPEGKTVYGIDPGSWRPRAWSADTAEPTLTFKADQVAAHERGPIPDGDISFEQRFEQKMDEATWTLFTERNSLFWVGGNRQNGLHFNVRGTIQDLMARDYAQRRWPVGTRPFELACEYEIPVNKHWQAANCMAGWWIGLSSEPADASSDDAVTVLFNVTPGSFFAGVLAGPPLEYHAPGDPVLGRSLMNDVGLALDATPAAAWQVASVDSELRRPDGTPGLDVEGRQVYLTGTMRREIEMTLRISRSADDVLTFAVHKGRRLQNDKPWWSARWKMPKELADVPLEHLIIKRTPIPNHHPTAWAMQGRITNIKATLDPPHVQRFAYLPGHEVLKRGAVIELAGSGFDPDARVEVGGQPAEVEHLGAERMRITLPDLAEDRTYDLCVVNPNGTWSFLPTPLPYGQMLTGVKPTESLPAGGREVEVEGAGFSENTQIIFGETAVKVSKVLSPTRAMVKVPAGDEGPVALKARTAGKEHAGTAEFGYAAHPYIFYTEETLPALREKFNDPFYAAYKKGILARGRAAPVVAGHGGADKLLPLVGAWICTGEDQYKDKALLLIDRLIASMDGIAFGQWQLGSATYVAIAYDALFAELSQEQRAGLQEYMHRSIRVHIAGIPEENTRDDGRAIPAEQWYYTNISNTNPVCNGGAGMASLALRNSSADARKDLQYAIKHIRKWADQCIQPDGANVEGAFYAIVGAKGYFPFAEALAHAANDTQLLDMPNLEHHATWWKNMLGGNGRMYMFNDAYPHFGSSSMFESLARHYDQDFMRWMAARHGDRGLFGLLFRDDKPAPEQFPPPIPTLHVFESKSIAGLRSSPELHANMTVGIKGNDNANTHHAHPDVGHMIMILNGEQILSDDGYISPSTAQAHSVLLIDGEPADITGGWITDAWENGPWRAVVMDMRVAYFGMADRIRRHYVMYDDKALVVLDDVVPDKDRKGIVPSYFQAGGDVALGEDGNSAQITGRKARLALRSHGPTIAFNTERAGGAEGTTRNPIWGSYKADPDKPMVTVMLAADPAADEVPEAQVVREDGNIAVTFPDGQSILFRQTEDGWAFITKDDNPRPLLSKQERNTEIPEGAKKTKATFFEEAPKIDGLLNDKAWKDCEVVYDFKIVTGDLPADHPGRVRIGYDAENLYIGINCVEKNLPKVVADVTERDGPLNLDDSVEIFIDTNLDRKTYYQLMINANGVLYDGFGWNSRWDGEKIKVETALSPNKDGWLLEMSIPWETLEIAPPTEEPLPMGLQIARNHFQSKELSHWAPTGTHNNHMPWMYGVLIFNE